MTGRLWWLQNLLEDFAPAAPPRVPQLLVECVAEIERRGLQEVSSTSHVHPLRKSHRIPTKEYNQNLHSPCVCVCVWGRVLRGVSTGFLEESVW